MADPRICGFVIRHDKNDLEAWQVDLPDEVLDQIYELLEPYDTQGCSVRSVHDMRFDEIF